MKRLGFSDQTPDVVAHHTLITLALVALVKFHHILVEALTMLFGVVSHTGFKEIQMGVHHVQFLGYAGYLTFAFIWFETRKVKKCIENVH